MEDFEFSPTTLKQFKQINKKLFQEENKLTRRQSRKANKDRKFDQHSNVKNDDLVYPEDDIFIIEIWSKLIWSWENGIEDKTFQENLKRIVWFI